MKTENNNRKKMYITPMTDIFEDEHKYTLTADMPGTHKEDLNITVENNTLEISGLIDRTLFKIGEDESSDYYYKRVFKINKDIDPNQINAELSAGVLTMNLVKSEALKPRKIAITAQAQ